MSYTVMMIIKITSMYRQITLQALYCCQFKKSLIKFGHLFDKSLLTLFKLANKNMGFVKGGERLLVR